MKIFKYQARTKEGAVIKGKLETKKRSDAVEILHGKGYTVVTVEEDIAVGLVNFSEINIGGIPVKEIVIFMRQFATMISAGLPVTQALRILIEQAKNPKFKRALKEVLADVEGGVSMADALKKTDGVFDEITINLVEAGEKSGNLEDVLERLAIELEKKKKLQDKIQSAFVYPAIMLIFIIVVIIMMMVILVPAIKDVYAMFGAEDQLPWVTRSMIWMSNSFLEYWWLILIAVSLVIIGVKVYLDTPKGQRFLSIMSLKVPIFGQLITNMQLAQFTRVLSLLLSSGLSILEALKLTSTSLFNILFKDAVAEAMQEVEKGTSLSLPLSRAEVFPLIVSQMVAVGEETGVLDKVLDKMAEFYEAEVDFMTENLSTMLEPLMLAVMGGVVGFIAAAVYLPMFNIGNVMG